MSNVELAPAIDTTTTDLLDGRQIDCSSLLAESPLAGLGYLPSPNAPVGSADRYATHILGSMFEATEDGASFTVRRPYAEMPEWMQNGTNLAAACWLGRAIVDGDNRVAVIDLNHAEDMTDNLAVFVKELSATDLCGVVAAEPEGIPSEKLVQAASYIKKIIGGLDHLPVVSTNTSRVEVAHSNMREMLQSVAALSLAPSLPAHQERTQTPAPEELTISAAAA